MNFIPMFFNPKATIIFLIGLLLLTGTRGTAQNKIIRNQGFYYTLEASGGFGLTMDSDYQLDDITAYSPYHAGFKVSANWFRSYHLSVGTSLGYVRYQNPGMNTLPLMANAKWFTGKPAKSFLFYAEGGYALRLDKDRENKGFVYEAGIGYRYRLQARKNFLLFKLGYNGFKTKEWLWELTPNGREENINEYQWYYLTRPAINFTIAFYHSTRY